MRRPETVAQSSQVPILQEKASKLALYVKSLSLTQLKDSMKLTDALAEKTHRLFEEWTIEPSRQLPAIDAFIGDIYSGLQVQSMSVADRDYANSHLFILSGLYGVLRALDGVLPYRLEMGYKLPNSEYHNLYHFWGNDIAEALPSEEPIINLSAVEYTKAVLPYLKKRQVVSPRFLTIDKRSSQPKFVTVHAKIARGAFAHWLITDRIEKLSDLTRFHDLGYVYYSHLSTVEVPVFVCRDFRGLGLSVRLS